MRGNETCPQRKNNNSFLLPKKRKKEQKKISILEKIKWVEADHKKKGGCKAYTKHLSKRHSLELLETMQIKKHVLYLKNNTGEILQRP